MAFGVDRFRRAQAAHLRLGRQGEALALRLLEELGLEPLCRNYRHGRWEIDIVARDGATLCFVEVKTRRHPRFRPAAAVGRAKRQHLRRAALHYLRELQAPAVNYRFDIVEVVRQGRRWTEIRHWPNAFGKE